MQIPIRPDGHVEMALERASKINCEQTYVPMWGRKTGLEERKIELMRKYILMTVLSTFSFICHAQQYEVGTTTAIWKNPVAADFKKAKDRVFIM